MSVIIIVDTVSYWLQTPTENSEFVDECYRLVRATSHLQNIIDTQISSDEAVTTIESLTACFINTLMSYDKDDPNDVPLIDQVALAL